MLNKLDRLSRKKTNKNSSAHKTDEMANNHYVADRLLLQYINDRDITEAFDAIPKLYG